MLRGPKVFLNDERPSNLDTKPRVQMRADIKELQQRLKTTTVYVTQYQVEAVTLADKIAVRHDSVVEQEGAPFELYHNAARGEFDLAPLPRCVPKSTAEARPLCRADGNDLARIVAARRASFAFFEMAPSRNREKQYGTHQMYRAFNCSMSVTSDAFNTQ